MRVIENTGGVGTPASRSAAETCVAALTACGPSEVLCVLGWRGADDEGALVLLLMLGLRFLAGDAFLVVAFGVGIVVT